MAVLLFPNLDVLRLALANGVAPRDAAFAPARSGIDSHGRTWIEPTRPLSRDALAALGRLGVQTLHSGDSAGILVQSWAELLPLKRAAISTGPILFEMPNAMLARIAAACRRLGSTSLNVQLLNDDEQRAWLICESPPTSLLLRAQEPNSEIEAFIEQVPGLWVRAGWSHPLPNHLPRPAGRLLWLQPPRSVVERSEPIPIPTFQEYALTAHPKATPSLRLGLPNRVPIRLTLQRTSEYSRELAWVFPGASAERFWEFCAGANERLLRQFEAAAINTNGTPRVIVRPAKGLRIPPFLPLAADGYHADPRIAGLYIPSRRALRPVLRPRELTDLLSVTADRFMWLEAGPNGEAVPLSVPVASFQPVPVLLQYAAPAAIQLTAESQRASPFAFERFASLVQEERWVELEEPESVSRRAVAGRDYPVAPPRSDERHNWFARTIDRLLKPFKRPEPVVEPEANLEPPPRPRKPERSPSPRVEQTLASPDALVHGQDRATRRHHLESRLLGEFPRLGPQPRAAGWTELAEVYAATGNPADAAICWINAAWDARTPQIAWLEQWLLAECRTARQAGPIPSLDRWLSEPGRFGAGRVVAAYAVLGAHQAMPPADLIAALPRVIGFLDQHFEDLPARSAWLARLAITQLCAGDALGLARWRDRILARLRDKGPGLDLDEPSFLRFHGTASPDRFQTAREWLVRTHKPILDWVGRLGSPGRLQWAGIDSESECTAAYAHLMLAWGLGCLGERTRSRDWTARARKVLGHIGGPGIDPAVHPILSEAFHERIRDVQEGRTPKPGLPPRLRERIEQLNDVHLGRYAVDKLRRHSRILEPVGSGRDFGGLDLRVFRGPDLLGERLQLLADRSDPAVLAEEAKQILAACAAAPSSANVPRAALTLLDLAPQLDAPLIAPILELAVPAASWMESWLEACSWSDAVRADRLPRFLRRLLDSAFTAAAWCNQWPVVRPLVEYLLRRGGSDPALRIALGRASGPLFRSLRKLGYRAEAESLLHLLDPGRGAWPADSPSFPPSQFGLAVGWFAVGDEEAGNRILDDARNRLFVARTGDDRDRTELAIAYAEALGFAPPRIALGRLEEIFQLLDRVSITGSTNRYFTLRPLQLIDTVVRSVVTEDFALGPAVRGWLDDDEFLIRRRIHRDMAAVLRDDGME
ncbi:MAG TPA: hypothetical protein VGL71_09635 [Urbifossiella sp.]|jgi:hypothetical protein